MSYAEASYFNGEPCQHVAAWEEHLRLERIRRRQIRARANREWARLPSGRPMRLNDHILSLSAERRAQLNAEWEQ